MDLNNFGPFDAQVWGTFSDWILIIVTGLTVIYLIRTFHSQQELKRIEIKRYIESIKPNIVISILEPDILPAKGNYVAELSIIIKNTNGVARNAELVIHSSHMSDWRFWIDVVDEEIQFPIKKDLISTFLLNARVKREVSSAACTFFVEFEDEIGNLYRQFIVLTLREDRTHVEPSIPNLIKGI